MEVAAQAHGWPLRPSAKHPRRVIVLGATGSIGTQALDVVARNREWFPIAGLAAGSNWELLARQARQFEVPVVAVADESAAAPLRAALPPNVEVLAGPQAATELAGRSADVVLNGMTGAVGLRPTLAALDAGSTLALANKESLIIGGPLVKAAAVPGQIVPVDSEHSALAQCLRSGIATEVSRLVLTASGGPFRGWPAERLDGVTAEQALAHPTWNMGPVVTINSATMVNKGLEVIEAHLLFDIPFERIDVVVHPQSMVHSMVEFSDGSTIAQVSPPDMRLPIALGMSWPDRVPGAAPGCDWTQASSWTFEPLDEVAFPAVNLARAAGTAGATAPAVFNAANEVAVAAFLAGQLSFPRITEIVADVLCEHTIEAGQLSVADVLAADTWARERAHQLLTGRPR